ncbi:MAG: GDSL-type esterase/lipase family protein, partial [Rhizomicrobium sp.]
LTLTRPKKATVALKDLGAGHHTIRLEKISETQNSMGTFDGFYVASSDAVLPAPQYDRRIEFIGDSFTVGYGNISRGAVCTSDDVRETTDTSEGFPPQTAKHFGAAYRIMAFSGRGMVRNYSDVDHGVTLPVLYQYSLFDKSAPAPQDGWQPDVYIIGLGTNDFSTQLAPTETWKSRDELDADYVRTYIAFVKELHAKNPKAHFILMASSISFDGEFLKNVTAVTEGLKKAGIKDVDMAPYGLLEYSACHGHPSLKDDVTLSNLLIERIARLPKFATATP